MQEHPVPQNVTSFEFKLIGDMTLRQFGYVGSGVGLALLLFFLPIDIVLFKYLVKYPIIILAPLTGFALAFMPVEGRPLDKYLTSFFKAVFGNTLYIWKKEGSELPILHDLPHATITDYGQHPVNPIMPQTIGKPQMSSRHLKRPVKPLDVQELSAISRVSGLPQNNLGNMLQNRQPQQESPAKSAVASTPYRTTPKMTSFAGDPKPIAVLPAKQAYIPPVSHQSPVTVMREPYQKPLVPKKIPFPDYQMPKNNDVGSMPVKPMTTTSPQMVYDQFGPHRPQPAINGGQMIASTSKEPAMTMPLIAAQGSQNKLSYNLADLLAPSTPHISTTQLPQPAETIDLKEQNKLLMDKLQQIEQRMQQNALAPAPTQATGADESKLNNHVKLLESALQTVQQNMINLTDHETKYQSMLNDVTEKLNKAVADKQAVEDQLTKLKVAQETDHGAAKTNEEAKSALEAKLSQMQQELLNTKSLFKSLEEEKEAMEQTNMNITWLQNSQIPTNNPSAVDVPLPQYSAPVSITPPLTPVTPIMPIAHPQDNAPMPDIGELPSLTSTPNAICGYIFDTRAKPLTDVIAVIKKAQGPTMRALKTNRVGQFTMVSSLPNGKYEVNFEKNGYIFEPIAVEAKGEILPPIKVLGRVTS